MNPDSSDSINHIPSKIGHYQIRESLGSGSSSTVYKAYDSRLSRFVAIKLLHAYEHNVNEGNVSAPEAKTLASIHHNHVVAIYDVVSFRAQTALVMEYLPGETLADRMIAKPPDLRASLIYALEIAKGLHAIHQAGLVHQDIKAENILFDENDSLKIGDLGIAKPVEQSTESLMAGSIHSLSPEQVKREHISSSSDLFSLGVLLYQMLAKRHPFSASCSRAPTIDTATDEDLRLHTLDNILHAFPEPPRTGHERIDHLVMRLLSKSPEQRVESAQSLAMQLKSILNTELSPHGNITLAQDNPSLEIARATLQLKQETKVKRYKWFSLLILLGVAIGSIWIAWPTQVRYVAVLNPQVSSGESIPDIALIQASVSQATIKVIQALNDTKIVAADEIERLSQAPEKIEKIKQITAADEVFLTRLDCLPAKCAVTFSRWEGTPAVLMVQEHMQISTDRLLTINDDIQLFLTKWLAGENKRSIASPELDEERFRSFLALRSRYQMREVALADYIVGLESFSGLSCESEEICYALLQAYRKQFVSQREGAWLDKARELVATTNRITNKISLSMAEIELSAQNYSQADEWLNSLESKHSLDDSVKSLRARWYFSQGLTVKGIALLSDLIEERPSAKHLFNYALMLFKLGETDESIVVINDLLQRVPDHIKALELYAILQFYRGDWNEVISAYNNLLALNQLKNPNTQSNLGFSYLMVNDSANALKHLQSAYDLSPSNPQILINLADAHSILGDKQRAKQHYQKAIELVNQLSSKTNNDILTLAQALVHVNRRSEARSELLKVESQSPQDPFTIYYISLVYAILGEVSTASAYKTAALEAGIPEQWYDLVWFNQIN